MVQALSRMRVRILKMFVVVDLRTRDGWTCLIVDEGSVIVICLGNKKDLWVTPHCPKVEK